MQIKFKKNFLNLYKFDNITIGLINRVSVKVYPSFKDTLLLLLHYSLI